MLNIGCFEIEMERFLNGENVKKVSTNEKYTELYKIDFDRYWFYFWKNTSTKMVMLNKKFTNESIRNSMLHHFYKLPSINIFIRDESAFFRTKKKRIQWACSRVHAGKNDIS
jgi:hypothetical protein